MSQSIYQQLKAAGLKLEHHESDLYVKSCEAARQIIALWEFAKNVTTFRSPIDGELWCDLPFAYDPWWTPRISHSILITIKGGCLQDVEGLPDGWTYTLCDLDNIEQRGEPDPLTPTEKLEDQISDLTDQVNELDDQISEQKDRITELEDENTNLSQNLSTR